MATIQRIEDCLATAKRLNSELNAFISIARRPCSPKPVGKTAAAQVAQADALWRQPGTLQKMPVAIKDNISMTGLPSTCAAKVLQDYEAPINATVVDKLHQAGAFIIGKTNMDEFAMGSHTVHSCFGSVKQPRIDGKVLSAGGSSGGSAVAVASNQCQVALGTDTGGSVRLPAAYCGIIGFKPSYGLISRYGVIPYANSLDTIGLLSKSIADLDAVFRAIEGPDQHDPTCLTSTAQERVRRRLSQHRDRISGRGFRIGVPTEYNIVELKPSIRASWKQVARLLQSLGHTVVPVTLPHTQHAPSSYFVLGPAEATSNLAKYDGVQYGSRLTEKETVLYSTTRTQGIGPEVRRRILLGSYSLSSTAARNYFLKAQKIRQMVRKDFDDVFSFANPLLSASKVSDRERQAGVDFLLTPTTPTLPPLLIEATNQDPLVENISDIFTIPSNLAGVPAISIPVARAEGETTADQSCASSVGIQIIGQYGTDEWLLKFAKDVVAAL